MTIAHRINEFEKEFGQTKTLNAYNRFTQLWHLLLKISMDEPSKEEFKRVMSFISQLSKGSIFRVLANPGIDQLINLDPPLETILAHQHERLDFQNAQRSIV